MIAGCFGQQNIGEPSRRLPLLRTVESVAVIQRVL